MAKKILITSPSLDTKYNVSGISSVTSFIISNNPGYDYIHFTLGKRDDQRRGGLYGLGLLQAFAKWVRILIIEKEITVHFNSALEKRAILRDSLFILTAWFFRRRMVIHLHGGKFLMADPPKVINGIIKIILSNKAPKIVLSPLEQNIITKKYGVHHIHVLPNCTNLKDAKLFTRSYSATGRPLNLLFIGRIVESKGIEYIYNACLLLKQRNVKFNLFFAGKGPEEGKYVPKFFDLLQDNFHFKGVISGVEKISLIKDCDVFLLPSTYGEGLPMALLECMSFGLIPITTDDGSMQQVVRNNSNGFIVKKRSAEEIAQAVCKLSDNRQLLKSMGENSKTDIFNNYDPESYIRVLNAIYSCS